MWQLMVQLTPVAVIAMSINSINTFVDALFVGQFLGEKALVAISLAFPLSILTNAFAAMLGVGGASLLSISIGSKDETTQGKIFGTISILAVIFSLALMCFGWFFAEDMIAATSTASYKDRMVKAVSGDSYIMLIRYGDDQVEIETVLPYGASSNVNSPHYTDQMHMYVNHQRKKMSLDKDVIMKNAIKTYHPK